MRIVRKQLLIYVAIGIVVVAIGARFLLSGDSSPEAAGAAGVSLTVASPAAAQSSTAGASAATASPSAAAEVVVDVTGAVVNPGVYSLPQGSRVCDALDLAGGTTAKAETSAVNLAALLVDGQQIVIPEKGTAVGGGTVSGQAATGASPTSGSAGAASASSGTTGAPGALVNLNTATLEELDTLNGVGPSTAQKIIDYREQNGGFKSVEELQEVSGIGDAKYAALKDLVTI